jgi:hypothetical protein
MSRRTGTLFDDLFPDDLPEFTAISQAWPRDFVLQMLAFVWAGFDALRTSPRFNSLDFSKDYMQLERSLTDLHMLEITLLWKRSAGFESFIPHHEPWEFEIISDASARPPSADIGFVLASNRRLRWAIEAKVLRSSTDVSRYLADLQKYLEGRGSPLAVEAALAGYQISGETDATFDAIQTSIEVKLTPVPEFSKRAHRESKHIRNKTRLPNVTPRAFCCHHMLFPLTACVRSAV